MEWRRVNGTCIQVGPYPPLVASRTPKGGWRLENVFVVFLSDAAHPSAVDDHYGPEVASETDNEH